MKKILNYIDGEHVEANSKKWIDNYDPSVGEVYSLIPDSDEKDVEMFAPIVQEIMENTTKLPGVTLKAPPEISDNWRDGH